MVLRNMLTQRRMAGKSTIEHKKLILEHMERTKSLEYTAVALKRLYEEIEREIGILEEASRIVNPPIRLLLNMLQG
jgi:hypothetical protein